MIRARLAARPWCSATILGALAALPAGCDQPTGSTRPTASAPAAAAAAPEPVATPEPAPEPARPREILGRRTQDIRDPNVELKAAAGGVENKPKIVAKDPITLAGNAYVTVIGQSSILKIQHDLDLYQALNGDFPKTREEFMEKVIKENGTALPMLPFYQEYGYDVPNHRLIIIEYPERKEQANYPK